MNEGALLCGQYGGFLDIVDLKEFKNTADLLLKNCGWIKEMCKTGENGVYALACSQAMVIVKSKDDKSISTISTHL